MTNIEFFENVIGLNQWQFKNIDKLSEDIESDEDIDTYISDIEIIDSFEQYGISEEQLRNIGKILYYTLFNFVLSNLKRKYGLTDKEFDLLECHSPHDGGEFLFDGQEFKDVNGFVKLLYNRRKKKKGRK